LQTQDVLFSSLLDFYSHLVPSAQHTFPTRRSSDLAGIDTGLGQRREVAGRVAIELHEDQIPDLDIAVTVFVGRARRATPDVGTVIVENFGTGAAGAGIGHLPEVVGSVTRALVVANANDAFARHADFVRPDVV